MPREWVTKDHITPSLQVFGVAGVARCSDVTNPIGEKDSQGYILDMGTHGGSIGRWPLNHDIRFIPRKPIGFRPTFHAATP